MKITEHLLTDHKTFRKVMHEIDAMASELPEDQDVHKLLQLVEFLKDQLLVHGWCEDSIYYPAVRHALTRTPSLILNATYIEHMDHEHARVDALLDRLENQLKSHPVPEVWAETYALFARDFRAHMKREEQVMFPLSEKVLGTARLEALSRQMDERRTEIPRGRLYHSTL